MPATLTAADTVARLSAQLIRAVTEPRLEMLDTLLTEDFAIWYNFSNETLDRAAALAFFNSYFPTVRMRYDDIRVTPTAAGWVQQQLVSADGADGFAIRDMPTCVVVTLAGDRIARMEEYLDTAQAAGFDGARMRQA
jgi:hypothetical protein